jgi:hypothetical protein
VNKGNGKGFGRIKTCGGKRLEADIDLAKLLSSELEINSVSFKMPLRQFVQRKQDGIICRLYYPSI